MAALAVGPDLAPKESFFKGLTEVENNERNEVNAAEVNMETDVRVEITDLQLENVNNSSIPEDTNDLTSDLRVVSETLTKQTGLSKNSETRPALQKFLQRLNSVKTANQLNCLLSCAGSSVKYGGAGRGKIPCQPASIARRSSGMP